MAQSHNEEKEEEKVIHPPLTLDELLSAGEAHLNRNLVFELDDGNTLERSVTFRRLTFVEVSDLSSIPKEEDKRYTRNVVMLGSIEPKFETVDDVNKAPHGFVRNYSTIILNESGKDPFLE